MNGVFRTSLRKCRVTKCFLVHNEMMNNNIEVGSSIGPYGFEYATYALTRVLRDDLRVDASWSGAAIVRVCVQTDQISGCCSRGIPVCVVVSRAEHEEYRSTF